MSENDEARCEDAASDSSDLLLGCIPTIVDVNEVYDYDGETCSRTYDQKLTYENSQGFSREEIDMNLEEDDI